MIDERDRDVVLSELFIEARSTLVLNLIRPLGPRFTHYFKYVKKSGLKFSDERRIKEPFSVEVIRDFALLCRCATDKRHQKNSQKH